MPLIQFLTLLLGFDMYCTYIFSEAMNVCKGDEKIIKECHQCTNYDLVGENCYLECIHPKRFFNYFLNDLHLKGNK